MLLLYFSVTFLGNFVTLFSLLFSCSFISTHYPYMYINIDKYLVVSVTYLNLSLNNYFMPHVTVAYFPVSDVPIKFTLDGSNVHACNGLSIVQSNNLFPKYVVSTHN